MPLKLSDKKHEKIKVCERLQYFIYVIKQQIQRSTLRIGESIDEKITYMPYYKE